MYQSIQEGYAVLQIRPTPTEELKQFLADRLLHTETVVISLWWRNVKKKIKTQCEITHANCDYWQYIDSWNTLISTYVHGQVHTLTNLRKAKHIFPFPASAFTPSTCRQQRMKLLKAVMWTDIHRSDDECVRLTRLPYLISETCDFTSGLASLICLMLSNGVG